MVGIPNGTFTLLKQKHLVTSPKESKFHNHPNDKFSVCRFKILSSSNTAA